MTDAKQLRIEHLKAQLATDPNDSFTLYALALEYKPLSLETAAQYFDTLLSEHPEYLPTYYHAAEVFSELEERERAEDIYQKGLALSLQQADAHAHRELQNAYQNFQFEED